jgi:hypothetical protein
MKPQWRLLSLAVLLLLFFVIPIIFSNIIIMKDILMMLVVLAYVILVFISAFNTSKLFRLFLITVFESFVIFEILKFVQYSIGLLPYYTEQPFYSAVLSLIIFCILIGFISLLSKILKSLFPNLLKLFSSK